MHERSRVVSGVEPLLALLASGSRRDGSGAKFGTSRNLVGSIKLPVSAGTCNEPAESMEARVRLAFAGHVQALRNLERGEDDAIRVKHSIELERLRESVCVAALGVRGADEVREFTAPPFVVTTFAHAFVVPPYLAGFHQGPRAEPPG